jgi:DNA-binding protein HU-beta
MIIDEHFVPSFKPAKVFVEQVKESDKLKAVAEK